MRKAPGKPPMTRVSLALLAMLAAPAIVRAQPAPAAPGADDPLSLFGQDVSAAVDRAVDLVVYATLCGVGNETAGLNLRYATARKLAECFKADSKAGAWSADLARHFDGKRALLVDLAQKRGKEAICGVLRDGDGKTLSALGRDVVADGARYRHSAEAAPIARRSCP